MPPIFTEQKRNYRKFHLKEESNHKSRHVHTEAEYTISKLSCSSGLTSIGDLYHSKSEKNWSMAFLDEQTDFSILQKKLENYTNSILSSAESHSI